MVLMAPLGLWDDDYPVAEIDAIDRATGSVRYTIDIELQGTSYRLYFDLDASVNLGSHVEVRAGVNNLADRRPPIIGFNANPLLVNGNMLAATYDTFGRYLFVGLTAKY